jgi:acyl dehydratase
MIYYPDILEETYEPQTFSYNDQQVMLYAVGIGMGADPLDARELPFVYERRLKVLPTAATVLAHVPGTRPRGSFRPTPKVPPGRRISEPNMQMLVHGSQRIVLHKALPPAGTFTAQVRILDVWDKGPGRGAILYTETVWTDAEGDKAVTLTSGYFFRGDGGCGARTAAVPAPHAMPDRAPDRTVEIATRPDQALVYRLNGDRNPIHCDPEIARKVGFPAPILHGYCTYGLTCRAILQSWCDYDPELIASHEVRFSAPVYPGETLAMDMWRDGEVVSFEVRAPARDVTVIKHGKTVLRA